jgi:hypothetical protein
MIRRLLLASLLRGMLMSFSDLGDPGGGGAPPEPAPPAGAPPAPTPEPPAGAPPAGEPAPGGEPPPDEGFEQFGQTYEDLLAQEGDTINGVPRTVLERHAREHKSYRERYQPIARAMNSLHPEDQQGFVQFLEAMTSDDPALRATAASWMREVLDNVSPAQAAAIEAGVQAAADGTRPPGTPPPGDDGYDPFDPASVEKLVEKRLSERDAKQREEQAIAQARQELEGHAQKLAGEHSIPELGDPTSPEFALLLFQANKLADTIEDPMVRLDKAAEAIRDRFATQGQALLKAKAAAGGPSPAAPEGDGPGGRTEPKSLDDAADAAASRIDKIMRGEVGT